jgi:hypothetical protein
MKIYVTNINPSTIKLEKLDKYLLNKNGHKKYELVSEEFGTHIIEQYNSKNNNNNNNKNHQEQIIYRIEPTLNTDLHLINDFNGYNLLFDKTNYVHIPVISQLPANYILTKMICFEYYIDQNIKNNGKNENKASKLKLVIECLLECSNALLENKLVPVNLYFVSSTVKTNNIADDNLFEEINRFLLELN